MVCVKYSYMCFHYVVVITTIIVMILGRLSPLENFLRVAREGYESCVRDLGAYISRSLSIKEITHKFRKVTYHLWASLSISEMGLMILCRLVRKIKWENMCKVASLMLRACVPQVSVPISLSYWYSLSHCGGKHGGSLSHHATPPHPRSLSKLHTDIGSSVAVGKSSWGRARGPARAELCNQILKTLASKPDGCGWQ